jgi:CheY-like chemotaxis protein
MEMIDTHGVGSAARLPVVLVVDDDESNLHVFVRVFRKEFQIVTAGSGTEALRLLADVYPDVAFVDLRMPGMDGAALLAALRDERPRTVRYLLTGYGDLGETALLVSEGLCSAVLGKPWEREAIRAAVEDALLAAPPRLL